MIESMIEKKTIEVVTCKDCGSTAIVKFGTYKGNQRYYCKECKRKFKDDNTAFHSKKPTEWETSAVDMYFRGMAISDIQGNLKQIHGYSPSYSVIYKWINKYTDLARKHFRDVHPDVGDIWIADETMLDVDGNHKVWFYDIIDRDTRFLLASRVTLSRTTVDAEMLMKDAEKCAGKKPKEVLTDHNYSYVNGIPDAYGGDSEHIIGNPFKHKETGESTAKLNASTVRLKTVQRCLELSET
jgi:putative transposase